MFISREQIEYSPDYQFRISNRRDITYYAFDDHIARIVAFGHKREMMKRASNNRSIAQTFTWRLRRSAVTDKKLYGAEGRWKAMKTYARWINAVGNGSNVVKHCSLARLTERRFTRHDSDVVASRRDSRAIEEFTPPWSSCWLLEFRHLHKRLGTSTRTLFNADTSRRFLPCINARRSASIVIDFWKRYAWIIFRVTARHEFKRAAGSQRSTVIFMIRAFRNWQLTVRSNSSNKK